MPISDHPISVIIVEDEPIIVADLEMQLQQADIRVLTSFESGQEILEYLKKGEHPDVLLLDIQLFGALDGIDVANQVNHLYSIPIVFLTSNTDDRTFTRAKLSFPHAFLSKPFRIKDVLHAIQLSIDGDNTEEEDTLKDRVFIRHKDALEKVMVTDILFIKADGAYTNIMTSEKPYVMSQTLKITEQKIKARFLVKVHRSYTINIKKIDKLSEGYAYIGKHQIPVSRKYREVLMTKLKKV